VSDADATEGWELVAVNREAFADLIETMDAAQAASPSLCGGWTNHQVAGHVTSFVSVGLPSFMLNMAKAGFNYDKMADQTATRMAEIPLSDLAWTLRSKADKSSPMKMFPPEMTLTDVTTHSQDIRRGLGLDERPSDVAVKTSLEFITTHKMAKQVVDANLLDGLALEATDLGWTFGEGEAISGQGEAVLMAIFGRDTYGELSGDGVETLKSRNS
jgi:uncharacterized protein (TIGR03083 family)